MHECTLCVLIKTDKQSVQRKSRNRKAIKPVLLSNSIDDILGHFLRALGKKTRTSFQLGLMHHLALSFTNGTYILGFCCLQRSRQLFRCDLSPIHMAQTEARSCNFTQKKTKHTWLLHFLSTDFDGTDLLSAPCALVCVFICHFCIKQKMQ